MMFEVEEIKIDVKLKKIRRKNGESYQNLTDIILPYEIVKVNPIS